MMIFRSMLPVSAAMLLACSSSTNSGSCHAFAPTPLTTQQPAAAGARTGVVLCSSLNHHHHQQHHNNNNNKNNDIEQRPVQNNPLQTNEGIVALREIVPLVFKMGGILIIKTAKDVVQYPPQALDSAIKSINQNQQTSPIVFIVKLLGVLLSKGVADAVYYPTIWTQRMIQCQSLDECDIASYDDNGGNDVQDKSTYEDTHHPSMQPAKFSQIRTWLGRFGRKRNSTAAFLQDYNDELDQDTIETRIRHTHTPLNEDRITEKDRYLRLRILREFTES